MNWIDALGYRPYRHNAFSHDLLAETDDPILQEIVKEAASDLSSPVAMVSLVLDHIQFFKASVGLPPILASSRGLHRDASFCQFVVRDGIPFEVNDAPNDPRIPQHVVSVYGFRSYLGVPIFVEETIVGSLCVLDVKKREFTGEDRNHLNQLAARVNDRLKEITGSRRQKRLDLSEDAFQQGLTELSEILKPIQRHVNGGYSAVTAIRSFLGLTKHLFSDSNKFSDEFKSSFAAALKANQLTEDLLYDIEASLADCEDCVNALEQLTLNSGSLRLSEVVTSAQDLARNTTKSIGGFPLLEFYADPTIYTHGTLAIAIVANCILAIAAALGKLESQNGIKAKIIEQQGFTVLIFSAPDLNAQESEAIANKLNAQLGIEPSVSIESEGEKIKLTFKAAASLSEN